MSNAFENATRPPGHWFGIWFRERIVTSWWWLGPASIYIAVIGGSRHWFFRAIAATLALISLRLFDDLADVVHDRTIHPERALCQLDSLSQPYVVCAIALLLSSFFVTTIGANGVISILSLLVIAIATRMRQNATPNLRVVYAHVILLKFPALAMALAPNDAGANIMGGRAACLYGFVGGFEVLHDPEARSSKWAALMFGLDLVCLALGFASCLSGRGE